MEAPRHRNRRPEWERVHGPLSGANAGRHRLMASEFAMVVSPGGVRLRRKWVPDSDVSPLEVISGGAGRGTAGVGRTGRPVTEFTAKARRSMRWTFNALPWEDVPRLAMVTFTYPGNWREVCPDGATLKRHLRSFRERWRRKWGGALGTWVLEYQPRPTRPVHQQHAPHIHLYVGLSEGVELHRREDDWDRVSYEWAWALDAWWEIVGSGDGRHRKWGVDVRPCFYGRYGGGRENGKRVGDYLWRESGKLAQKQAPEGFEGVKWWDVWGMVPVEHEREITRAEFVAIRRPVRLLRDKVTKAKVRRPSGLDGLSVTNVDGIGVGTRLLSWAQAETECEASQRDATEDARGVADGSIVPRHSSRSGRGSQDGDHRLAFVVAADCAERRQLEREPRRHHDDVGASGGRRR